MTEERSASRRGPIVLQCFDPEGRAVLATRRRWQEHVLDEHPELAEQYDAVRATVVHPDQINADITFPDRENVYRRGVLPEPHHRLSLRSASSLVRSIRSDEKRLVWSSRLSR